MGKRRANTNRNRFNRDLVERLHFHDPVVVVAADPERHRRRRIVDEHRAHVGVGRHQILHRMAGLGIEPHDAICVHRGGPEFTVLEISPVFGSKFPSEPWYIVSNQILLVWSNSMLRSPVGALSLNFLIGYSVSLSVFGSNLPMNISPKSVYQTLPSLSSRMSCGSVVGRTMSYWVTIARVSRPLGRGSVFSSYCQ